MLRVSLLGEQVVSDASGTVRTRSSRTLALLGFLVVHAPAPQDRHRLAATFWPDSTDEQALTNLRRELHHLRNLLGPGSGLVVTARALGWSDTEDCRVDVREFARERAAALAADAAGDHAGALARAAAAVGWYRGDFLPGGYDDWLLQCRTELEDRCVELYDLIREAHARAGAPAAAIEAARRRVRLRPLDELGYRRLMELQGDLGDRAGAVSTFHHCAAVLERELGIDPDPGTRAVLDGLLVRTGPPAAPPPVPVATDHARSGLAVAKLVGRAGELDRLRAAWRTATGGRPVLAVVRGDAGVGKSRLVAEIAETARSGGAVVATSRCFGSAGRPALAPVADWLRTPAVRAELTRVEPVWRSEVDRLVPSEATRARPVGAARPAVEVWQRHRFLEGLARALVGPGRPTLLVLDDLQWCDPETLAFLPFLLGLTPDAPVMVAATVRRDGPDHVPGLGEWTARMRAAGLLTEVELGPFESHDTARLAERISGRPVTDAHAELLQATTGGFPLHVVEAVRSALDPGPGPSPAGGLPAVLRARLEPVSPEARDLAGLAAAVGRNFSLDLLTEAAELDADAVVRAVDELWRRRILREVPDGYDFSHDLIRDEAYAQVSPPKRWLLHRRVAHGLELLHPGDHDAVSAQLAEQYARGGRAEQAVAHYQRAAGAAARTFAHGEAVRLLSEALAIVRGWPESRARSERELAVLEAMAAPLNARDGYSSPHLRTTLERSIDLAESLGRPGSATRALVGLWTSLFVQGRTADAHRTATRALARVASGPELRAATHFAFGGSAVSLGRPAEGLEHLHRATEHGGAFSPLSVGNRPDVHSRAWAAHAHWLLGEAEHALADAGEAVALARAAEHPYSLAVALAYAGLTHQLRRDAGALAETVEELRELCERNRFAYYREWALILQGWHRGGEDGVELARRGVENLTRAGSFARMPYWLSLLADVSARAGRPDAARAGLDAALVAAELRDDRWWLPEVMRMRAAYDDGPAAAARLRAAARLASDHGSVALLRRCRDDLTARAVPAPVTDAHSRP